MQRLKNNVKYLTVIIFVFNIILSILIIYTQLYIFSRCINDPVVHEWLHHIGLCILGIPNVQAPSATYYFGIYLVLPDWRLMFVGIPYYASAPTNQLIVIPLNTPSLAVDFPYLIAKIGVTIIPVSMLIIGVILMRKNHEYIGLILISTSVVPLIIALLLIQDIHSANMYEWLNNIVQFYNQFI